MEKPIYLRHDDKEFTEIIKNSSSCVEAMKNLGYICTGGGSRAGIKKRIKDLKIDISHWNTSQHVQTEIPPEEYFVYGNFIRSTGSLKRKVIKYKVCDYVCAKCGNDGTWKGEKLVLQLHHKDGDRRNNCPENLEFLCPNCHSQTDNFTGKNNYKNYEIKNSKEKNKSKKTSKVVNKTRFKKEKTYLINKKTGEIIKKKNLLKLLFDNNGNFTEVAKILGYTANAIKKWCLKYSISKYSGDYKKKSEIYSLKKNDLIKLLESEAKKKICKEYHISSNKLNELISNMNIVIKPLKRPIKLISPTGIEYKFSCINDGVRFLIKELNYTKNSMQSNIYKVLKGVMTNIFGWKAEYL